MAANERQRRSRSTSALHRHTPTAVELTANDENAQYFAAVKQHMGTIKALSIVNDD